MAPRHFLEAPIFAGAYEQSRIELAVRNTQKIRHVLILPLSPVGLTRDRDRDSRAGPKSATGPLTRLHDVA